MAGYNEMFLQEPELLAKLYPLYPYADNVVKQEQMKTRILSDKSQFTQVQGENKVAWCDIKTARQTSGFGGELGADYRGDSHLLVMRITYQKSGDAFPVYYLPWMADSAFRMKLKPSPNHPTQDQGFAVDPGVFVTAALQGCSIIVSGDPKEPVVYHLNAMSATGPEGEVLESEDDEDVLAAANAKRDLMLGRFKLARTEFHKEGLKISGFHSETTLSSVGKGVHLLDYMPENQGSGRAKLAKQHLGKSGGLVAQFGTVFGTRSSGTWKFYRQTRTRVYVYGEKSQNDWAYWLDPVCVPFWP